jgi:uncharacterized protein YacL
MIIPPDVNSENDMRWRLALANSISNIQTGEQLAAACVLGIGAIIVVGLIYLIVAAKSGAERPIKVYKKRAQMNSQEKRLMTGTAIGLISIALVACVIAFITRHLAIGAIAFAVSVLVATIVFEVLSDRADKRADTLKGLLDPDRLQLPKDLTLNDVVLWQETVEQAETQQQAT